MVVNLKLLAFLSIDAHRQIRESQVETGVILSVLVSLRAASILAFSSFFHPISVCKVQRKEKNILLSRIMHDCLGFVQTERC
jgi:hypothetical protein